jgi:hypothetical protein
MVDRAACSAEPELFHSETKPCQALIEADWNVPRHASR